MGGCGFNFKLAQKFFFQSMQKNMKVTGKIIKKFFDLPEGRGGPRPFFSEKLNFGIFSKFLRHFVAYDQ